MSRRVANLVGAAQGRRLMAGEPLVFHCNYYNYWLQKTVRLAPALGMDDVIRDAAESSSHALLTAACAETGAHTPAERLTVAKDTFAALGFGLVDFAHTSQHGGVVTFPVSHYGNMLRVAASTPFERAQNLFDQGFASAAVAVAYGRGSGSYAVLDNQCLSLGAPVSRITLGEASRTVYASPGLGPVSSAAAALPSPETSVDEAAVLTALSGLDLSGNEEGLIPRFGVVLTNHLANFYNRISFEFIRRTASAGLRQEAEELLVDAGYHCAFNTFGGIMTSAEWDAVVKPMCRTADDWVHGMVAVINALGWGVWRVAELKRDRFVVQITDDYESTGYLGMYGKSQSHVAFLAAGGVAGIMNLLRVGDVTTKPVINEDFYARSFEAKGAWHVTHATSFAQGYPVTEIVAEPRG